LTSRLEKLPSTRTLAGVLDAAAVPRLLSSHLPPPFHTWQVLDAAAVRANGDKWRPTREACLLPCANASAAAHAVRSGGIGWRDVCWKHYAEPHCTTMLAVHGARLAEVAPDHGSHPTPSTARVYSEYAEGH
jgi:hypothetical protein